MSLTSNKGLLSLMRCIDVRTLAEKKINLLLFSTFSLFWQVRPQGGSFPQRRVWDRGAREGETDRAKGGKKSCIDHFTSTIPLESITQTTLLMLKQHCLEYYCSSSYLMMWNHLKLTVFSVFGG